MIIFGGPQKASLKMVYSETCVLWTPWDQPKVPRLSRCPDFPGQAKCVDYAGVHIFKCPN